MNQFIAIGGTGYALSSTLVPSMRFHKHDVAIVVDRGDARHASEIMRLLDAAEFASRLLVQITGRLHTRSFVRDFEESASCALFFGPGGGSPLADARLRESIRERFDRTRGTFRPVPVVYRPGAKDWMEQLAEQLYGVETREPVLFDDSVDVSESMRRLILGVRGLDAARREEWERGWLRGAVRARAKEALNVNWKKLASQTGISPPRCPDSRPAHYFGRHAKAVSAVTRTRDDSYKLCLQALALLGSASPARAREEDWYQTSPTARSDVVSLYELGRSLVKKPWGRLNVWSLDGSEYGRGELPVRMLDHYAAVFLNRYGVGDGWWEETITPQSTRAAYRAATKAFKDSWASDGRVGVKPNGRDFLPDWHSGVSGGSPETEFGHTRRLTPSEAADYVMLGILPPKRRPRTDFVALADVNLRWLRKMMLPKLELKFAGFKLVAAAGADAHAFARHYLRLETYDCGESFAACAAEDSSVFERTWAGTRGRARPRVTGYDVEAWFAEVAPRFSLRSFDGLESDVLYYFFERLVYSLLARAGAGWGGPCAPREPERVRAAAAFKHFCALVGRGGARADAGERARLWTPYGAREEGRPPCGEPPEEEGREADARGALWMNQAAAALAAAGRKWGLGS